MQFTEPPAVAPSVSTHRDMETTTGCCSPRAAWGLASDLALDLIGSTRSLFGAIRHAISTTVRAVRR